MLYLSFTHSGVSVNKPRFRIGKIIMRTLSKHQQYNEYKITDSSQKSNHENFLNLFMFN